VIHTHLHLSYGSRRVKMRRPTFRLRGSRRHQWCLWLHRVGSCGMSPPVSEQDTDTLHIWSEGKEQPRTEEVSDNVIGTSESLRLY